MTDFTSLSRFIIGNNRQFAALSIDKSREMHRCRPVGDMTYRCTTSIRLAWPWTGWKPVSARNRPCLANYTPKRDVRMRMRLPCHTGRARQYPGLLAVEAHRAAASSIPPRTDLAGKQGVALVYRYREPTLIRASFRFDDRQDRAFPMPPEPNSLRCRGIAFALTSVALRSWQRAYRQAATNAGQPVVAQQFERPAERAHPFVHAGQTAAKNIVRRECRHRYRRPRQTAGRIAW